MLCTYRKSMEELEDSSACPIQKQKRNGFRCPSMEALSYKGEIRASKECFLGWRRGPRPRKCLSIVLKKTVLWTRSCNPSAGSMNLSTWSLSKRKFQAATAQ